MTKLEKDTEATREELGKARAHLRAVALENQMEEERPTQHFKNYDEEFEALLAGGATGHTPLVTQEEEDAVLQRAMSAAPEAPSSTSAAPTAEFGLTTPLRRTGAPPMTPVTKPTHAVPGSGVGQYVALACGEGCDGSVFEITACYTWASDAGGVTPQGSSQPYWCEGAGQAQASSAPGNSAQFSLAGGQAGCQKASTLGRLDAPAWLGQCVGPAQKDGREYHEQGADREGVLGFRRRSLSSSSTMGRTWNCWSRSLEGVEWTQSSWIEFSEDDFSVPSRLLMVIVVGRAVGACPCNWPCNLGDMESGPWSYNSCGVSTVCLGKNVSACGLCLGDLERKYLHLQSAILFQQFDGMVRLFIPDRFVRQSAERGNVLHRQSLLLIDGHFWNFAYIFSVCWHGLECQRWCYESHRQPFFQFRLAVCDTQALYFSTGDIPVCPGLLVGQQAVRQVPDSRWLGLGAVWFLDSVHVTANLLEDVHNIKAALRGVDTGEAAHLSGAAGQRCRMRGGAWFPSHCGMASGTSGPCGAEIYAVSSSRRLLCDLLATGFQKGLSHLGDLSIQFFQTLLLVFLFYFCRLLTHALALKGGRCNADNLLRIARGASSWVPLYSGKVLQGVHCGRIQAGHSARFRAMPPWYFRRLWLWLLYFSCLFDGAMAAAGGPPQRVLHERFRVPGHLALRDVTHVPLLQAPDVAQQIEDVTDTEDASSSSSSTDVEEFYHNVLFRVFGFGFIPEHYSVRLRRRTPLYRAFELIDVETEVSVRSSKGCYVPLMGAPVDESYPALWVPRWIERTSKRLAVLDATHVGWESSVLVFEHHVVNVHRIASMLQHIWQPHWMIFIPARSRGPLTLACNVSIETGDVIFISPDAFCPCYHDNSVAAYMAYDGWGVDPGDEGIPEDLPGGPRFLQLIHDGQDCLVEVESPVDDQHVLSLLDDLLAPPMPNPRIIKPVDYFHPSSCRGVAVAGPYYIDPGDAPEGSYVVFLDLRNICMPNSAVVLRDRLIADEDLGAILDIGMEAIDGYLLAFKGGRRRAGFTELWQGCVLRADVLSIGEVFSEDSPEEDDNASGGSTGAPDRDDTFGDDGHFGSRGSRMETRSRSRSPRRAGDSDGTPGAEALSATRVAAGTKAVPCAGLRNRFLTAFTLLNACVGGGSVVLPIQADDNWSETMNGDNAALHAQHVNAYELIWQKWMPTTFRDDGQCPGADTPRQPPSLSIGEDVYCGSDDLRFRLEDESFEICTLLDSAKTDKFWVLCDDLAWFLQSLATTHVPTTSMSSFQQLPLYGSKECVADGEVSASVAQSVQVNALLRIPILLDSALGDETRRQLDSGSAVVDAQIPPGWVLPNVLFESWPGFCLTSDVSDWKLHVNSIAALSWSRPIRHHQTSHWDLHLYTDGSCKHNQAGWAVAIVAVDCIDGVCAFVGCFGGRLDDTFGLGASAQNALQAEQCALCWACLWVLPQIHSLLGDFQRILLCWDCTSAGHGASGECCLPDTLLSGPLRGFFAYLQRSAGHAFQGRHVKAHEGHPWNELADAAANVYRERISFSILPIAVAQGFQAVDWSWAPVLGGLDLPPVVAGQDGAYLRVDPIPAPTKLPPSIVPLCPEQPDAFQDGDQGSGWGSLSIKVLGANLQGINGKHKFLEAQLVDADFDVAFFQETKSRGGMFSSAHFHRFAADHDSHWGVAIWVKKRLRINGQRIAVTNANCRVLCSEARIIAVHLKLDTLSMLCVSVHLPQQGRGTEDRMSVLQKLSDVCSRVPAADVIMIGIDANARVPCAFGAVTGDIEFGESDSCGFEFVEFLAVRDIWIPSTFSSCHSGASATWRHAQGRESRIDFICVGGRAGAQKTVSWVDTAFDLLNSSDDHCAIAFSGDFWWRRADQGAGVLWRRKYDKAKLSSAAGRELLNRALYAIPPIPWAVDASWHAAFLESASHTVLSEHFSIPADKPRSAYISEAVWKVRGSRNKLKAHTRFWKEGRTAALAKEGFARLAGRPHSKWWHKVELLYQIFAGAINFSTGWIKTCIKAEKQALLQDLIRNGADSSLQDLQKAIKSLGLGRRACGKHGRPVPLLLNAAGEPISSGHALDTHWLHHFAAMEAGEVVSMQQFEDITCAHRPPTALELDFAILPTFMDVESQFRKVRPGAAPGLDGLPPEFFRAAPQRLAELFHPLMVKSALRISQPVQWRGGILFEAYKNNGSPSLTENYRSLFVSSVPGKCFHRILRNKATGCVEGTLDPLHCGGRKSQRAPGYAAISGCSVTHPSI